MKAKKAISMGAILVITAMLCIPAFNGEATEKSESIKENTFYEKIIPLNKVVAANLDGNVKISTSEDDDIQPTITRDPSGRIVVTFATQHTILDQDITITYSEDGLTWTTVAQLISEAGVLQYPSIVGIPEAGDVGLSYMDPFSDYPLNVWRIADITDTETYNGLAVVWGETEDYEEVAVTYVHYLLLTLFTNHNMYMYDLPGCPYLAYWTEELGQPPEIGGQYFDGQSILKTSPASNIDMVTGQDYFYLIMEHANETTGHSEIAFKKSVTDLDLLFTSGGGPGGMDKYADIEAMPWQRYLVKGDFDAKDPNTAASGRNVAVVYMANDNIYGDWDIKCAYSSDDGENWGISTVAESHPTNEVCPAVYMSGNNVFCAYIKEGNLYLIKSEDCGATWGEHEQINEQDGTVVAESRATEISDAGIVWTDNRNENKDIYYAPLPAAILNVKSISGGIGVSAVIANVGTADATNVEWTITIDAPIMILGRETTGTIETLEAGEEEPIKSGLVLGLGPATITIIANGATATKKGFVLGPLVLGVK
jgi:hypothetical protein